MKVGTKPTTRGTDTVSKAKVFSTGSNHISLGRYKPTTNNNKEIQRKRQKNNQRKKEEKRKKKKTQKTTSVKKATGDGGWRTLTGAVSTRSSTTKFLP
jgi:hypothetical protein